MLGDGILLVCRFNWQLFERLRDDSDDVAPFKVSQQGLRVWRKEGRRPVGRKAQWQWAARHGLLGIETMYCNQMDFTYNKA